MIANQLIFVIYTAMYFSLSKTHNDMNGAAEDFFLPLHTQWGARKLKTLLHVGSILCNN